MIKFYFTLWVVLMMLVPVIDFPLAVAAIPFVFLLVMFIYIFLLNRSIRRDSKNYQDDGGALEKWDKEVRNNKDK
ncbi:hypothetical protein [Romboutsia sp.]|uniref:hypothetical protein n=1 Tax=Romboutsia sp. TaxID=1965302 RepID=UPI003F316695